MAAPQPVRFSYGSSKQVVAKTSGELVSLTVKEGDAVTDGQVIGSFDNTANDNQLRAPVWQSRARSWPFRTPRTS